jgi:hypothetical protein
LSNDLKIIKNPQKSHLELSENYYYSQKIPNTAQKSSKSSKIPKNPKILKIGTL